MRSWPATIIIMTDLLKVIPTGGGLIGTSKMTGIIKVALGLL